MQLRAFLIGGLVLTALACGGGGLGGGGSEFAQSMATHFEGENEQAVPCLTYGEGSEATVADFSFRFEQPILVTPENQLPWIGNSTERSRFSKEGIKGLVIVYEVKNNTPVKKRKDVWFQVHTQAGESLKFSAYNPKLYRDEHGIEEQPRDLPPNKWVKGVEVLAVPEGDENGAVVHLYREEEQLIPNDPRGRKHDVVVDQAVVDLGDAVPGPHINPEKR